jgi:hypothetical protein
VANNQLTDQQIREQAQKGNPVSTNGMDARERERVDALWNQAKLDAQKRK